MSQFPSGTITMENIQTAFGVTNLGDSRGRTLYNTDGSTYLSPSSPSSISLGYFRGRYYTNPYIAPIPETYTTSQTINPPPGQIRNPIYYTVILIGGGGKGGSGGRGDSGDFHASAGGGGGGGGSGGRSDITVNYTANDIIYISVGMAGNNGGDTYISVNSTIQATAGGGNGGGNGNPGSIVSGGTGGSGGSGGTGTTTTGNAGTTGDQGGQRGIPCGGCNVATPGEGKNGGSSLYGTYGQGGNGGNGGDATVCGLEVFCTPTFNDSNDGQSGTNGSNGVVIITWYYQ